MSAGDRVRLYVAKPNGPSAHASLKCARLEAFDVETVESFQDCTFDEKGRPQPFTYVGSVKIDRPSGLYFYHVYAAIVL